jgi:hypothetical protein
VGGSYCDSWPWESPERSGDVLERGRIEVLEMGRRRHLALGREVGRRGGIVAVVGGVGGGWWG